MNLPAIELLNLRKQFGAVRAVDGVSLSIGAGEFFSLLGPSGSGKSTLLRLIAGFEQADSGSLRINGADMSAVPPQQRPVNTVFQNYALFPHLSVLDNIAFGPRMKKLPRAEVDRRAGEALELVDISELRGRMPHELSGGQQQRVALARALANQPAVLLLDEPLAAVDAKLRARLQSDLKSLQRRLGTTFICVTHDQDEALALSDRLAVLDSGRVAQIGAPREVYERPRTRFAAMFLGACNCFAGTVIEQSADGMTVKSPFGLLRVNGATARAEVCLGVRRENILLGPAQIEGAVNSFEAVVLQATYTGAQTEYVLEAGGARLQAWAPCSAPKWEVGSRVWARLPSESLLILEDA